MADRTDQQVPQGMTRNCSIALTLDVLQDTWTFLVIREAFFGAHRFGEFASRLRCSRATLSRAIDGLVSEGILRPVALADSPRWKSYVLTEAGLALYPVFLGLMRFGDTWLWEGTPPLSLFHRPCRSWFSAKSVWKRDLAEIDTADITVSVDPEYWLIAPPMSQRRRKASADLRALSSRPCTVERTLEVIGDRWSFLVLREFFHGNHFFDKIQRNIGIASNILADRLRTLSENHIVRRVGQGKSSYELTTAGRGLYSCMVLMKEWGDNWRLDGQSTIHLRRAGSRTDETAVIICPTCSALIVPQDVSYLANYGPLRSDLPVPSPIEAKGVSRLQ